MLITLEDKQGVSLSAGTVLLFGKLWENRKAHRPTPSVSTARRCSVDSLVLSRSLWILHELLISLSLSAVFTRTFFLL